MAVHSEYSLFYWGKEIVMLPNCIMHPDAINPLVTHGLSHSYHLDWSTSIFRGNRISFSFLFHFSMKIKKANRIAPDGTPRFALFCLPMSHKKGTRLIWVKGKAKAASHILGPFSDTESYF